MQVAIFGSGARGTSDKLSDFDIIAVLDENEITHKDHAISLLKSQIVENASISVYGKLRYRQMLESGSPFVWHIFLEHKPLQPYSNDIFKLTPNPYITAHQDVEKMFCILKASRKSLINTRHSTIYEAGLHYVCARNIAMFASKILIEKFDFSRKSPFSLNPVITFPLSEEEYNEILLARLASTRGFAPPILDHSLTVHWSNLLIKWADFILTSIRREDNLVRPISASSCH
ncbi:nucleotidyltransferase domain-containing protein [Geothrix mesophila]|uniref:nucleotidyltransferase domain-containing protein n=1 Tax=Geothrix mesophila TaxID=2922723 RepID=UPI001FAC427F|nr:nucleotidyltransferase domain-containing protein [Geothrix sp. SG198]